MNRFRLYLFSAFLTLAFNVQGAGAFQAELSSPPSAGTVIRIGLLDFESEASYLGRQENIQETIIGYLRKNLDGLQIVTRFYTTEGLSQAVRKGEVEFFLGSSGFFVEMRPYGVRDIGTITSKSFPNPNQCVAGVMFVRKDRTDLTDLASLKGRRAATTAVRNFMTYQLNLGEIAFAGYDPDRFFRSVIETDNKPAEVMRAVAEGRADVGLLRACMPEALEVKYPQWRGLFRVVNEHAGPTAERLGCGYSTDMYPGWTLAASPHVPPVITRHVAVKLLGMDPNDTASGFSVSLATEFDRVNALFRAVRSGPYAYLREWTLDRILSVGWPFLLFFAGLLGAWGFHSMRLEKEVANRTRDLREALKREKAANETARIIGEKLDKAQRAGIVGQLSSIFAHDLCQPLSAIRYYLRGLRTLLTREGALSAPADVCLTGLSDELQRAAGIIDRVRSYAKSGAARDTCVDFSALILETTRDMEKSGRLAAAVTLDLAEKTTIMGDPLELRLLVVNLLKNASEALRAYPDNKEPIAVRLMKQGVLAIFSVSNTGPVLTDAAIASIGRPLASEKTDGLGLGLMICKSIAEAHHARLVFIRREADEGGGLTVRFELPLCEHKSADDQTKDKACHGD